MNEVNPMNRLFRFLQNYRSQLWGSSFASIVNKFFDLMPPILTAWFIDAVSGNIPQWIPSYIGLTSVKSIIIFLLALTVFIFLGESFFEWLFKKGFMQLAQNVQHDLRVKVYDHLQNRELSFFENQRVGNLMAMLNDDINQLERFLNDSFNTLLQMIVLIIFAGTSLCLVNFHLGLLAMAPIPFIVWGSIFYQKKVAPHYKTVREKVGDLSSRLENNISGIQVIKSFTAEQFELERVQTSSAEYRKANYRAIQWNAIYVPVIRMVIAIGFVGTLALGAWWIHQGIGGLTIGALAFFGMMTQRLLWPVTRLGHVFNEYERARASARRVFQLLDSENKLKDGVIETADLTKGEIRLNDLSFAYNPTQPILNKISLHIKSGQFFGIVGITGAGKTTLIKLLMRFYDPNSGNISINGTSVKDFKKSALRKHFAFVSQEVYLFHGTVKENIAYGLEDVNMQDIIAAAKKSTLHEFIEKLPQGYHSIIGERGIKLSGGQRQRLSLARAILKDAPILILDEATSSVDTETEKTIQKNLDAMMSNKTLVVIAHRLSTIRNADQIIVMGNGTILEQGSHEELIEKTGYYQTLIESN